MDEKVAAIPGGGPEIQQHQQDAKSDHAYDVNEKDGYSRAGAIEAEQYENKLGVIETVKAYPAATWWAFVMSSTIVSGLNEDRQAGRPNLLQIMEAYCVFLMGNFIAIPRFAKDFGEYDPREENYYITTPWQSAVQMGGPVGAFIGVLLAGPLTSAIGYRWATILGLMLLNAFIFVFYFANSLGVMLASQLLEGVPWGIFIANAPAYCESGMSCT